MSPQNSAGPLVKMISTFFLLILMFGCQMKEKDSEKESYLAYVNQIINSFANEVKKEYGLVCTGSGGRMPYDVEAIVIDFVSYNRTSVEDARNLEVKLTEKFIQTINTHKKIRPFLREYPFNAERAQVGVSFHHPNMKRYSDGSVAFVFQAKNKIFYRSYNEENSKLIPLKEEPYEEAFKIVNESSK